MIKKHKKDVRYFIRTISIVIGLVLVWRGIWHFLDDLDVWLFGGYDIYTSLAGIIIGLLLLYIPDGDLKEIEKL